MVRPQISLLIALAVVLASPQLSAERVKDIAAVDGVRGNQLIGYGLVMGLDGMGEIPQAMALIERAIGHCRETGDCYMEPECLRIRAELLLQGEASNWNAAEAALRESVHLAQAHRAKSWELRAATSLARLWQQQGREEEARGLLAPVYDWFTEGFDTRDLKDAKALLEELA